MSPQLLLFMPGASRRKMRYYSQHLVLACCHQPAIRTGIPPLSLFPLLAINLGFCTQGWYCERLCRELLQTKCLTFWSLSTGGAEKFCSPEVTKAKSKFPQTFQLTLGRTSTWPLRFFFFLYSQCGGHFAWLPPHKPCFHCSYKALTWYSGAWGFALSTCQWKLPRIQIVT